MCIRDSLVGLDGAVVGRLRGGVEALAGDPSAFGMFGEEAFGVLDVLMLHEWGDGSGGRVHGHGAQFERPHQRPLVVAQGLDPDVGHKVDPAIEESQAQHEQRFGEGIGPSFPDEGVEDP